MKKKPDRDFRPLAQNPNKHTSKGMGMLDAAMSRQGYVAPMTAAADGSILDGNARIETAAVRFPGVEPIIVEHDGTRPIIAVRTDIPNADAPMARDIIVTANRIAEVDLDYDLEVMRGFLADGLDLGPFEFDAGMLESITGVTAGLTDPDEVPAERATDIKLGDLFELGSHRLLCGDSTKAEDVARVMRQDKPFLCVTDPPYGVNYDPQWRSDAAEKGHLAYAARRVGQVTNDDRADWLETWALTPSDVIYSWHPAGATSLVHAAALQAAGFVLRMQIIWAKSNFPISRGDYHVRHEPCWYAVRKGKPARRTDDRTQTTLWEINLDKNVQGGHSTQKPVECMARPMRNHEPCDVYEPFSGSGTTLIAAEQLGRRCFAIEIEPRYVQVAVDRWEQFTGQKAVKVAGA